MFGMDAERLHDLSHALRGTKLRDYRVVRKIGGTPVLGAAARPGSQDPRFHSPVSPSTSRSSCMHLQHPLEVPVRVQSGAQRPRAGSARGDAAARYRRLYPPWRLLVRVRDRVGGWEAKRGGTFYK